MIWERITCVAVRTCDGCFDGIYPGEGYWTTEDRLRAVCSGACMRLVSVKEASQ